MSKLKKYSSGGFLRDQSLIISDTDSIKENKNPLSQTLPKMNILKEMLSAL